MLADPLLGADAEAGLAPEGRGAVDGARTSAQSRARRLAGGGDAAEGTSVGSSAPGSPPGLLRTVLLFRHTPPSVLADMLDRELLLQLGFREPLPEAAVAQARRMHVPMAFALVALIAARGAQMLTVIEGWVLLLQGVPDSCSELRGWLVVYCLALTIFPVVFIVCPALLAFLARIGLNIRDEAPEECRASSAWPSLDIFGDLVLVTALLSCCLLVVCGVVVWLLQRRLLLLTRLAGRSAASAPIVERILAAPPWDAEADAECSICLNGEEEGAQSQESWRALLCGHIFHERCLLQWLRYARQCPLCRLDLEGAYLPSGGAPAASAVTPSARVDERATESPIFFDV